LKAAPVLASSDVITNSVGHYWSKDISETPSAATRKAAQILLVVALACLVAVVVLDQYVVGKSIWHTALLVLPILAMLLLTLVVRLTRDRDRRVGRPLPPPLGLTKGDAIIGLILLTVLTVGGAALMLIARLTPYWMWLLFSGLASFGLTVLWLSLRRAKNRRNSVPTRRP
jgi:hypothetical protein